MTGKELQTETKQVTRDVQLADFLESKVEDFRQVANVDSQRFMKMVKNAILRDPEIAEASARSVYLECMKAAADGLVIDGREAALVRFKTNKRKKVGNQWQDNWQTEVAYIPMVAGIMKRVRNSGEIASWSVELVFENEYKSGRFEYRAAPDPYIRHDPLIVGDRGPVVAAYSAVRLRDGSYHYEVMTRDQLDSIKGRTKSRKKKNVNGEQVEEITGPWATDEEEMFRKTVIRRHSKRLPVSSELMDVASRVDSLYDMDPDTGELVDVPAPVAAAKRISAAKKLRQATKPDNRPAPEPEPEDEPEQEDAGEAEADEAIDGEIVDAEIVEDGDASTGRPDPEDAF